MIVIKLFYGIFVAIVYAYLYVPILILVINSFNNSRFGVDWQGFTINWYNLLISDYNLLQAVQHSIIIALISATFATVIGSLIAISIFYYYFPGKVFISTMLLIVMISPDIVMAISLLALFILFRIKLGFWSLLFSHITFCIPLVSVNIYSRIKGLNTEIVEAARDLGASELITLRKIILPLVMPAVITSWLLSFAMSIDDIVISSFVTGSEYETLPLKIYSMIKVGISPEINALVTILLLLSFILAVFSQSITSN